MPSGVLPRWLDAQELLNQFGHWALWGSALIVFAQCGLLIGFVFPGDSLLFTVGVLIGQGTIKQPLWLACLVLIAAAVSGNAVGYEIGRFAGPTIFRREDSRLFRREYVDKTTEFFEKYGNRAIVLAQFVPIVRTFITVTAGIARMPRRRYLAYSGLGALLWAGGVTALGQVLGHISFVRNNIEVLLILIVLFSVFPVIIEFVRERRKHRAAEAATSPAEAAATREQPPAAAEANLPG